MTTILYQFSMNTCFSIRSILYLNLLCFIIAQKDFTGRDTLKLHDNDDLITDKLNLVLKPTDKETIFHCSSRVELDKQQDNLTISIETPIKSPPNFLLKIEKANSTTIRVRIVPNEYVGINRLFCHWSKKMSEGVAVDLRIGANPGSIQLREPCRAYDRLYVLCRLYAPVAARASLNNFSLKYTFNELGYEEEYMSKKLVNTTEDFHLVFKFIPRNKYSIPKRTLINVNLSLGQFGSSNYTFKIEPIHVTEVNFHMENISSNHLVVVIEHSQKDLISPRLCAGSVKMVENKTVKAIIRDIEEKPAEIFPIDRLRPSTNYEICLRCYYETTDESFNEEVCKPVETKPIIISKLQIIGIIGATVVGCIILIVILIIILRKTLRSLGSSSSRVNRPKNVTIIHCNVNSGETRPLHPGNTQDNDYTTDPIGDTRKESSTNSSGSVLDVNQQSNNQGYDSVLYDDDQIMLDDKYQPIANIIVHTSDQNVVSPDTVDLRSSKNM